MSYPETVQFLYALGNESRSAKLGLDRMRALLERLGHPERGPEFVHVAGTNGKGSVCALIESCLRAAGRKTGLYTSPHLKEPTERIQIEGQPVPANLFSAAFDRVHRAAEAMLAEGELDHHPTYFETVTLMGLLLFHELGVQTVVLEVGLGGRLDATNVVLPQVAVITPVDYDHEAYLGRSLEAIAGEKAGIIKPGVPVVLGPQRPEAEAVLAERAAQLGAPISRWAAWRAKDLALTAYGSRFVVDGRRQFRIECPLAGEHQVSNVLTAIAALDLLEVPAEAIEEGIRTTRWPGRLERVSEKPEIVLDGAHNPAGAEALARHLRRFYSGRRIWLVYGAMRDKAVSEAAGHLFPLAEGVILTAPRHPRAVRPEALAQLVEHPRLLVASDVERAIGSAMEMAAPKDAIFITGSLFLVGEARSLLVQ
ncbi:MAG: bifunctional folylpolyglutamate synthase/dihydrofolate synthase [Bryobacteraceae bacterium]|nr:bifunctional folylpolyglutamate synthase/dihydrofolate synthase [Bryobacteraceae bacterium]